MVDLLLLLDNTKTANKLNGNESIFMWSKSNSQLSFICQCNLFEIEKKQTRSKSNKKKKLTKDNNRTTRQLFFWYFSFKKGNKLKCIEENKNL